MLNTLPIAFNLVMKLKHLPIPRCKALQLVKIATLPLYCEKRYADIRKMAKLISQLKEHLAVLAELRKYF